jgi:hypothetical protein
MSLGRAVLLAGLPYVRPMPPIPAVAGQQLVVKCPVAGYPIDTIIWEKGKSLHLSLFCGSVTTTVSARAWNPIRKGAYHTNDIEREWRAMAIELDAVCETVLSNAQTYLDDSLSEPETNTQLISI